MRRIYIIAITLLLFLGIAHGQERDVLGVNRAEIGEQANVTASLKDVNVKVDLNSLNLSCMDDASYSNLPMSLNLAENSNITNGFRVAQRITGFDFPIRGIRFFGIQAIFEGMVGWVPMNHIDPLNFELKFFDDNDGIPGDEITSLGANIELYHTETSVLFSGAFEVFYWDYYPENSIAGLPDIFWISLANTDSDVWFLWLDVEEGGNDKAMQYIIPSDSWVNNDFPAAICLAPDLPDSDVPERPKDLEVIPHEQGELTSLVKWLNPNKTFGGAPLVDLEMITLTVNGIEQQVFSNPVAGSQMEYEYVAAGNGLYTFEVFGTNEVGDGPTAKQTVWIGHDLPSKPQNVHLSSTPTGGLITWEAPEGGLNGGYLNYNNLNYSVIRMPDMVVGENITDLEFNDDFNPELGYYRYKVIANNDVGEGGAAVSNFELLGGENLIMYETFEVVPIGEIPTGWTIQELQGGWSVQAMDYAGGQSPEMILSWSPVVNGVTRLATHSFSTNGNENIVVSFRHYISSYESDGNIISFQVAFDDGEWNDYHIIELGGNYGSKEERVFIKPPVGTSSMSLAWEFSGNTEFTFGSYHLDDIAVQPVEKENDLRTLNIKGNSIAIAGKESIFKVDIQNAGLLTQNNYSIKLKQEDGTVLTTINGGEIEFAEIQTINLPWIPTQDDFGTNIVFGEIVLENDEDLINNTTELFTVFVGNEGEEAITIGEGTNLPGLGIPFDFFFESSLSQSIYYDFQIGQEIGIISSLSYTNSFETDMPERDIMIWIGETDKQNLNSGWIPIDELTLVYEGQTDFPSGENIIHIPFDTPYLYGGGNLVVYTNNVFSEMEGSFADLFYSTKEEGSNRTRLVVSTEKLNPAAPLSGYLNDWYPNITLFFNEAAFAHISGNVIDSETGNPVEGVVVQTSLENIVTMTDEEGEFSLKLFTGTYDFTFKKYGYFDTVVSDIELDENETDITSLANVQLTAMPSYTISGIVKAEDNFPLEDVLVTVQGFENFETHTNSQGHFLISNVFEGIYDIIISKFGYHTYEEESFEIADDVVFEGIILSDRIVAPTNLSVTTDGMEPGTALFKWETAEKEFRWDNGTSAGQIGLDYGTPNRAIGSIHRNNAVIQEISWFLTHEGGPHHEVTVWILGLDDEGLPNAFDVLYRKENVPNVDMKWNTLLLPREVEAPNGFYIALSYNGFVGMSIDDGSDPNWPFQPYTHYGTYDITAGGFFPFDNQNIQVNPMVRAKGINLGEITLKNSTDSSLSGVFDYSIHEHTFETDVPTYHTEAMSIEKTFLGYNIFLDDLVNPVATDIRELEYLFTALEKGSYLAGVGSGYSSGNSDISTLIFSIENGVNVPLDENIFSYSPNPVSHELYFKSSLIITATEVFNALGVKILSVSGAQESVNMSPLPSGLYIIRVSFIDGSAETFRIQKM